MNGPSRWKLPNRRASRSLRMVWRCPSEADLFFHLRIGFDVGPRSPLEYPGEIWLTPSRRSSRYGGTLMFTAHDTAESLSLHLQHGHQLADLRARFKQGSLARCAIEWTWLECAAIGADVPPVPADLPKALVAHWDRFRKEDEAAEQAPFRRDDLIAKAIREELSAIGFKVTG